MSARTRLVALLAVCLLAVGSVVAYLLSARGEQRGEAGSSRAQSTTSVSAVESGPRIVFRHTGIGPDYGRVAMVPLGAPSGPRALTEQSCDRVFAAAARLLCLSSDPGVVTTYRAVVHETGDPPTELPLTGTPSRARLSRDGSLAATTSFVAGDSYAAEGFSTRTVISRIGTDRSENLEAFRLVHRGKAVTPVDRNFWGVTFAADGDTFFVTAAFDGENWLARGSLARREVTTLRPDAECPSLSPDEARVAYKKLGDRAPGDWRIAVLDLASGQEVVLAEDRRVDDQVEWLDDGHVVYGLPGEGTRAAETNVWSAAADGTGEPVLLIEQAWSPAVVR